MEHKIESLYEKWTVSASGLSMFEKSPMAFREYKEGKKEEETRALSLGTAIHCYVLQPEIFDNQYVVSDIEPMNGMMGDFLREKVKLEEQNLETAKIDYMLTADKINEMAYSVSGFKTSLDSVLKKIDTNKAGEQEYLQALRESSGKHILSSRDMELIQRCDNSLKSHKVASKIMYDDVLGNIISFNEKKYTWKRDNWPFVFKGILDRIVIDHEAKVIILTDLKTSGYPLNGFSISYRKYKYYRQMMMYINALHHVLDFDISEYKIFSYIVAVQTNGSNECAVFSPSEESLVKGHNEIESLLVDLNWHYENDRWDYSREYYEGDGIIKLSLNETDENEKV